MTRLLVHIGSPKTGTTAIQHALHARRIALRDHGVLYPAGGLSGIAHHVIGASVHPGRRDKVKLDSTDRALDDAVAQIVAEAGESGAHTVVLSTEYLWGEIAPDAARRLTERFDGWEIGLIVYLRRQDLLAQSLYVQAVKGGYDKDFATWLSRHGDGPKAGFRFDRVLDDWRAAGATQFVVRIYEPGQVADDITTDFLQTIAPNAAVDPVKVKRGINTSPNPSTVALLRRLNARIGGDPIASQLRRRIIGLSPQRERFEPHSYFAPGEARAFLDRFADGNAAVATRYLGRADGRLFHDCPSEEGTEAMADRGADEVLGDLLELLPELARGWPLATPAT